MHGLKFIIGLGIITSYILKLFEGSSTLPFSKDLGILDRTTFSGRLLSTSLELSIHVTFKSQFIVILRH